MDEVIEGIKEGSEFYVVIMEPSGATKYPTYAAAQDEAQRLCKASSKHKCHVLKAIGTCERAEPPVTWSTLR